MRRQILFYVIALLLALPVCGFGQAVQKVPVAPNMLFQVGGLNAELSAPNIKVDAQGNTYVTARIFDRSKTIEDYPSPGYFDTIYGGFIAKYNPAGALVWVKGYKGEANGLDIDNNGNVTLIGIIPSTRPRSNTSFYYNDAFILHFDNNGNLLWEKVIESGTGKSIPANPEPLRLYFDTQTGYKVASDDAGNLVAVYTFGGSPDVDGTIEAKGITDGLVVKYDTDGNVVWKFNLGSTGTYHNIVEGALVDKDNNIIIAGYTDGTVDYNPLGTPFNVTADNTIFLAKYSPAGILIWIKTINSNANKNNIMLTLDSHDNIYINGSSRNTLDFGVGPPEPSKGVQDIFFAKYSTQGDLLYHKSVYGKDATMLNAGLAIGGDNSLYLTGNYFGKVDVDPSAAVAELNSNGANDMFMVKYDENGNYQWSMRVPGIMGGIDGYELGLTHSSDYYKRGVQDIAINSNDEIYVVGEFQNTVNFNATGCGINSMTAHSMDPDNRVNTDMFFVRYAATIEIPVTNNLATAPVATTICPKVDPDIIIGSRPVGDNYTYQWQESFDNRTFTDITNAVSKDFDPPVPTATTYYRRMLVTPACAALNVSNVIKVTLLKAALPNNITAPAELSFCNTGDLGFMVGSIPEVDGIVSYQWQQSTDKINFTNITGATRKDYDPSPITVTTSYRRVLTYSPCSIAVPSDTVTATIVSVPLPTISAEQSVCLGNSVTLTATGGTRYSWSPATGLSAANIASPIARPATTTNYSVTIFNDICVFTLQVKVIVVLKPIVNAGADIDILKGDKLRLNPQVSDVEGATYSWTPTTYLDNPAIANPTAKPTSDITYRLTVTSAKGCFTASDDVTIKVHETLNVPNAFTPNGDGINDVLAIPGLDGFSSSTIIIFNRLGQPIFKSHAYSRPWDGTNEGKPLPIGTYYYVIELNNDGNKRLSGSISLMK